MYMGRSGAAQHAWVHRICVAAVGVVAVLLVVDQQVTVYTYVLTYGWAILGAGFGPQVLLALFWRGATGWGCVAGLATGFVVAIGWKLGYEGDIELYNLPVAFLAAAGVNVLVSKLTSEGEAQ